MKTLIIIVVMIAVLLLGGYYLSIQNQNQSDLSASNEMKTNEYKNLLSSELATMLENKDFRLVDVHIPEQKHIPKTDYLIPFNEIDKIISVLSDKNEKIVLYCRSGSMSKIVAEELVGRGYNNVFDLTNGLNEWTAEGREISPLGSVQSI
jgi:rhodanese-related sulfurtransferase